MSGFHCLNGRLVRQSEATVCEPGWQERLIRQRAPWVYPDRPTLKSHQTEDAVRLSCISQSQTDRGMMVLTEGY